MDRYQGECLCGTVRYEIGAPTLFFAHCHCEYCRRAHGAAYVSWVGAAEDRFELTGGDDALRWFASSAQSRRGFCARCGTTLFFASTLCPGEIHVTRASLTGPIDREPQLHCFWDQRAPWASIGEGLPCYEASHEGLAKYRAVQAAR